jgi:OmpA-OmpF porin, OOP family
MGTPFKKQALAAAIAATMSLGASAADNGFFVGGSIGQATAKDSESYNGQHFSIEDSDTGYKAFAGYMFTKYFGLEGGYVNFGEDSDHFGYDGGEGIFNVNAKLKANGTTVAVIGAYPISESFDVFAKIGSISFNGKIKAQGSDTFGNTVNANFDTNENDLFGGVGVLYKHGHFGIRAEGEMYDANNLDDLYLLSIGLQYNLY